MAILKHIASKNANYGSAIDYLKYQHDEFHLVPVLDENGNMMLRDLGQYLSTKSIYGEFLKAPNKKIFRQAHSDELAQYEEALQILKQHSPDGKFPTMKDLRAEKEQLTIQKDAQYDTYRYFKDYHKELQTVCANVDSILGAEQEVQQHEQQHTRKYEPSL